MVKGLKDPIKHGERGKGGNREVETQNEHSKKPQGRPANMHIARHSFCIKKSKKKETKEQNEKPGTQINLTTAKDKRKTKVREQKTRKNGNVIQPKTKQEKKQRKQ